jgi:RNA polymerase sigma factor (sigma-70 family)
LINSEDHQLVARVVSHQDTDAFGELVRRHQSHVRNFLRKLSGDYVAADDLAQDCFMHAWAKLQTFSGRGSFIGWLLKVAYTTFLQSKRKSKRYSEILEQAGHASEAESRSPGCADRRGTRNHGDVLCLWIVAPGDFGRYVDAGRNSEISDISW